MRGSIPGWLRASAALPFVAVVALQTAGDVGADPEAEATDVITVAAVMLRTRQALGGGAARRFSAAFTAEASAAPLSSTRGPIVSGGWASSSSGPAGHDGALDLDAAVIGELQRRRLQQEPDPCPL